MTVPTLRQMLDEARVMAADTGLPVRRKDAALYGLIAACLGICERVDREGLQDELREAVRVSVDIRGAGNAGRGRRFAMFESDVYILVARYVMAADQRNNPYRYAAAMREAAKRQIRSDALVDWLAEHGGVRALVLQVPKRRTIRVLHLTEAVEYLPGVPLNLSLMATPIGTFQVLR